MFGLSAARRFPTGTVFIAALITLASYSRAGWCQQLGDTTSTHAPTSMQAAQSRHSPQSDRMPFFMPPTSVSDSSAIEALKKVIEASGGAHGWNSVTSAKMRFGSPDAKNGHADTLLLDDWASTKVRYRRGVVGSGKVPKDHDDLKVMAISDSHETKTIPEFDQARVLADHLPGAAIHVVLHNPDYLVKSVSDADCGVGYICIDVYRRASEKGPYAKEEEWKIQQATNVPLAVQLKLPDVRHGSQAYWELIQFKSYETHEALLIPSSVTAIYPGGFHQERTLLSANLGGDFDVQAFDKELAR
jgi:hypothetical protein